jgi:hypothetical protein
LQPSALRTSSKAHPDRRIGCIRERLFREKSRARTRAPSPVIRLHNREPLETATISVS